MKEIINLLNKLDEYFEEKSSNEKWMMIGLIALVIGYISYSFYFPFSEEKYNTENRKMKNFNKSIKEHKEYLQSISKNGNKNYYVQKYDADIHKLESDINKTDNDVSFISASLDELSPLLFNKESWSKFLNSITKQAKDQDVNIKYIDNNYVDNNGVFGHVLQISVGCEGEYEHIVKFINQLEKSVLVTDIYGSHLYLDKNDTVVAADINISVWGVNN